MITVIHAPSAAIASTIAATVTVEAEYGSIVAEGAVYTAAHHQSSGPFAGRHLGGTRPSPCNDGDIPVIEAGTILVSHFDLDTLGGVLRAMGTAPHAPSFWDVAEFIDVSGPHKLGMSGASDADIARLRAFWAWSQANRVMWPRDAATDITEYVNAAKVALEAILADDPAMIAAGAAMAAKEAELNAASFVSVTGGVICRKADAFVNHLYVSPEGEINKAVVALNTKTGAVTVSFADAGNAKDIVQALWGLEAGGHAGIAGSPRGQVMTDDDLVAAVAATVAALNG
jgi:hypothetical protein